MGQLRVESSDVKGACVIRVSGDASVANAERLDMELARRCTSRPALAVVDLSGLTFIASLGLGALIRFQQAIRRNGGVVRLAALSERFTDVMRRAQFHQIFEMHDTVDAAIATPIPTT